MPDTESEAGGVFALLSLTTAFAGVDEAGVVAGLVYGTVTVTTAPHTVVGMHFGCSNGVAATRERTDIAAAKRVVAIMLRNKAVPWYTQHESRNE